MNLCPICLYVNSDAASACMRCGKFKFSHGAVALQDPKPTMSEANVQTKAEAGSGCITKPSGTTSAFHTVRLPAESAKAAGQIAFNQLAGEGSSASQSTTRVVLKPRLEVVRGEKIGSCFPVLEGKNIVGRVVTSPVDIDLTGQEPPERVWTSRQHVCIHFDGKTVILEDLSSLNGTYVNRQRVFPGQQRVLQPNDVIQVGTVQLRMLLSAERIEG